MGMQHRAKMAVLGLMGVKTSGTSSSSLSDTALATKKAMKAQGDTRTVTLTEKKNGKVTKARQAKVNRPYGP